MYNRADTSAIEVPTLVRVAVISDVHSNLEALTAVLSEIGDTPIFCLGDIVGYGANPNEVVALIREKGVRSIIGNHDYAVITRDLHDFNSRAAVAIGWTAQRLTDENRQYLASLPHELRVTLGGRKKLYFTHGSPDDILWEYVDPATHSYVFDHYLDRLAVEGIGLGHTHIPYVWSERGRVVFNPGSVGQPRSGDSHASYALVTLGDDGVLAVEHRKVSYDIRLAAEKIIREGLPEVLGRRLFSGV